MNALRRVAENLLTAQWYFNEYRRGDQFHKLTSSVQARLHAEGRPDLADHIKHRHERVRAEERMMQQRLMGA